MTYLGFKDILRRWVYTRRGVEKMMKRGDFPAPVFALNEGRNKAWHLSDIMAFEKAHPELTSEAEKWRKVRGYQRALAKGNNGRGDGV